MAAMNMNQEQFKQLIREEKPVLVDFWAPGAAIAGGSALRMRRLERNTRTALPSARSILTRSRSWRGAEGIKVIPTLVLFRNGKAVGSITAPGSKAEIDRFIQEAWRNNGGFRYEQQSCL